MSRFLVTWRSRDTQRTHPVGFLVATPLGFRFSYLPGITELTGFRAFVNFPDLSGVYESAHLFPFFSQRVMHRKRPDFPEYVEALGLPPDASDLDVLGRTWGQRKGDTVQVISEPAIGSQGEVDHSFLVSGTRHVHGDAAVLIDGLRRGTALSLRADVDNSVNPQAQLICTSQGEALGWVPDALIRFVVAVAMGDYDLAVLRANGRDWPTHMRLIVRLQGAVTPDFAPFDRVDSPAAV